MITTLIGPPAAWRGADIADVRDEVEFHLTERELDEFRATVDRFRTQPDRSVLDFGREDFDWPAFAVLADQMAAELAYGHGFVLLRGLPIHREFSVDEARLVYWGISLHLGRPVPQNDRGHLLGSVIDLREHGEWVDPNRRVYERGGAFELHTDKSDVVGLLCVQRAAGGGGASLLGSAAELHNVMLKERPDLLKVLYGTFFMDRMSEELPGELPYHRVSVFSEKDGILSLHAENGFIYHAQRFPEVPRLTQLEREALAYMDAVSCREGMYYEMLLEEGDIQFLNNYTVLHGRRDFIDSDELERRRHMVRVWLATWIERPLRPDFLDMRYGIPQRSAPHGS